MSQLFDPVKTQSTITDSVLVSFSGGKDSVVVMDLCYKYFKNVYPFFMYIVPGLRFQERMLQWYERRYGVEIIRIPHFETSNFYKYGSFRLSDWRVPIIKVNDVYDYVRDITGVKWIAAGERAADSIVRGAMIKHASSVEVLRGRFYPIAWWKKKDVLDYIRYHKLYLSPEQVQLGFSFRSLAGKELSVIKERYPEDYERILDYFPFAGAGVQRYEQFQK